LFVHEKIAKGLQWRQRSALPAFGAEQHGQQEHSVGC
jgi:hypothetical protein